jgi:hypothetical protein
VVVASEHAALPLQKSGTSSRTSPLADCLTGVAKNYVN